MMLSRTDGRTVDLVHEALRRATLQADRERKLDNAVRLVFGLYESEQEYSRKNLRRLEVVLNKYLKLQLIYEWEERTVDQVVRMVRNAYYAQ